MQLIFKPSFPTKLHEDLAELTRNYFTAIPDVDTVLVVNSCARGQAVPESDLDMAILVNPDTAVAEMKNIEGSWQAYIENQPTFLNYKESSPFAHLHLDIINGNYTPTTIERGEPIDYFEIEIGNQICYSAPMENAGSYFKTLQSKWLPYYNEELRLQRLRMIDDACNFDLDHVLFLSKESFIFRRSKFYTRHSRSIYRHFL
jgi:hypothetical protein